MRPTIARCQTRGADVRGGPRSGGRASDGDDSRRRGRRGRQDIRGIHGARRAPSRAAADGTRTADGAAQRAAGRRAAAADRRRRVHRRRVVACRGRRRAVPQRATRRSARAVRGRDATRRGELGAARRRQIPRFSTSSEISSLLSAILAPVTVPQCTLGKNKRAAAPRATPPSAARRSGTRRASATWRAHVEAPASRQERARRMGRVCRLARASLSVGLHSRYFASFDCCPVFLSVSLTFLAFSVFMRMHCIPVAILL